MNKQEAYQVLALLQANYPDSFRGMSKDATQVKINLWADMFADEPFELVTAAAKTFIATDTKGYMPAIGQIKETIQQMNQKSDISEQEVWNFVSKALRNSLYGSAEEFAKLPEDIKKIVGSPNTLREWAMMDYTTVQSVVASNFQRSFRAKSTKAKDQQKLPKEVKSFVAGVSEQMCLQKGGEAERCALESATSAVQT